MNQTIEKWLTIAALAGWVGSMGSLVGLAVRSAAPAAASRPVQVLKGSSPERAEPVASTIQREGFRSKAASSKP